MKHPTKDHSIFSIDIVDELFEEHMQLGIDNADFTDFVEIPNDIFDSINMFHLQDHPDSEDNIADLAAWSIFLSFLMCNGNPECLRCANLPNADTNKPGVTQVQVATIVEAESDSGNRFQKVKTAESDSR
ncbi:hypothetical protein CR513_54710, partial [Mucuna pruriens]